MKKLLILLLPVFTALHTYGQDTLFYDYYGKAVRSINNCYTYDVNTPTGKNGKFTLVTKYSVNGDLRSEKVYSNLKKNILHGIYKIYWDNGQTRYSANFEKNVLQGIVESFSVTGYKKRHEVYEKGVMTEGTCFDSLGNKVDYFPYEEMPTFEKCKKEKEGEARNTCFNKTYTNFLDANLIYPSEAKKQNIQGKVWVGFMVEKDGSISNVELLQDIGGGCGEEVLRVMKLMPAWSPGKQDGIPVRVKYRMPINFTLR